MDCIFMMIDGDNIFVKTIFDLRNLIFLLSFGSELYVFEMLNCIEVNVSDNPFAGNSISPESTLKVLEKASNSLSKDLCSERVNFSVLFPGSSLVTSLLLTVKQATGLKQINE